MNDQAIYIVKNTFLFIIICILGYFIIPVSSPIIFAFLTAVLLDTTILKLMATMKWSRKTSVIIIHCIFYIATSVLTYLTFTSLLKQIVSFSKSIPNIFNSFIHLYIKLQGKLFHWTDDWPIDVIRMLQTSIQQQLYKINTSLIKLTELEQYTSLVIAAPNVFFALFVYFTCLFMFQVELPLIKQLIVDHVKPSICKKLKIIHVELKGAVWGFFKAQIIISLIIMLIALPALYFILPTYALLLTIAITLTDAIPFLDSFFLLAPLSIMFFTSGQTTVAIAILVLGVVLMLIRRFLEPKLLGNHFNLPTLPTFIAMFIGLELFGIIGLLAGPLIVIFIRALLQPELVKN